ncbi:hypothetical protein B0H12DRAFT_1067933 [Mycena haematopus]|nr:hypothetical protein B0H12DRAFT_1067933 [Mycena haematopus]
MVNWNGAGKGGVNCVARGQTGKISLAEERNSRRTRSRSCVRYAQGEEAVRGRHRAAPSRRGGVPRCAAGGVLGVVAPFRVDVAEAGEQRHPGRRWSRSARKRRRPRRAGKKNWTVVMRAVRSFFIRSLCPPHVLIFLVKRSADPPVLHLTGNDVSLVEEGHRYIVIDVSRTALRCNSQYTASLLPVGTTLSCISRFPATSTGAAGERARQG